MSAEFERSPLLADAGFSHAFFTRKGGVSTGAYASLNFSAATGDDPARVRENLRRAAAALGVDADHVYFLSQVHGNVVRVVHERDDRERILLEQGDALVSASSRVACAVRVADCVPILIADRTSGAVAAVHAGWRGTVAGVIASAVASLRGIAGHRGELIAAVGAHISQRAFEVSPEVAEEIAAASPDPDVVDRSGARPLVDLRRVVRAQLGALGVGPIDDVGGCTVGEPERYFSFRRDGLNSGRHLAAILPRRPAD